VLTFLFIQQVFFLTSGYQTIFSGEASDSDEVLCSAAEGKFFFKFSEGLKLAIFFIWVPLLKGPSLLSLIFNRPLKFLCDPH
jgi:hypothetical protein